MHGNCCRLKTLFDYQVRRVLVFGLEHTITMVTGDGMAFIKDGLLSLTGT